MIMPTTSATTTAVTLRSHSMLPCGVLGGSWIQTKSPPTIRQARIVSFSSTAGNETSGSPRPPSSGVEETPAEPYGDEEPVYSGDDPVLDEEIEDPLHFEREIEELNIKLKDMKDQLLRSLAEQENTRRIAQRDVDSARQFAIKSFAKDLLEVSDNLTLALNAVPKDQVAAEGIWKNMYEGIEMTEKGLLKAFEKNGLVKFGVPGEVFDPNKHEALYEYVDPTKTPGTVGQVMKSGFMLRERVLRPAEVGVVKKS